LGKQKLHLLFLDTFATPLSNQLKSRWGQQLEVAGSWKLEDEERGGSMVGGGRRLGGERKDHTPTSNHLVGDLQFHPVIIHNIGLENNS
jgi:hypothetical protein